MTSVRSSHEELARLPEPFRSAVVLCPVEGLTHEQAARRLGWPVGTVESRLARGRERLRARLTDRGLAPTVGAIAAALGAGRVDAAVPPALARATVRAALRISMGQAAAPRRSRRPSWPWWKACRGPCP